MALIKCKECGHQVSSAAASCPKCGVKVAGEQKAQIQGNDVFIVLGSCVAGVFLAGILSAPISDDSSLKPLLLITGFIAPPIAALYYTSRKQ